MLDALLGNTDGIESVGELISGVDRYGDLCSCQKIFSDCDFWSNSIANFEESSTTSWDMMAKVLKNQGHIKNFLKTLTASAKSTWVKQIKDVNDHLVEAIDGDHEVVLDSSKEITRALFLINHSSRAQIIHLVRHPRDILASNYWRMKNGDGFKLLRHNFKSPKLYGVFLLLSAINWVIGNLLSELVRVNGSQRFLRIRYEDLIDKPEKTLVELGEFMNISMTSLIGKVDCRDSLRMGHNIGGNRMRLNGDFVLNANRSSRKLPKIYSVMTLLVTWPLLWSYGYITTNES